MKEGGVYCSPACGNDCTYEAFDRANRMAKELAKSLTAKTGRQWHPNVWENLGWHWSAVCEGSRLTVSPLNHGVDDGYHAFISMCDEPTIGGGEFVASGPTAYHAVKAVVDKYKEDLAHRAECGKALPSKLME